MDNRLSAVQFGMQSNAASSAQPRLAHQHYAVPLTSDNFSYKTAQPKFSGKLSKAGWGLGSLISATAAAKYGINDVIVQPTWHAIQEIPKGSWTADWGLGTLENLGQTGLRAASKVSLRDGFASIGAAASSVFSFRRFRK